MAPALRLTGPILKGIEWFAKTDFAASSIREMLAIAFNIGNQRHEHTTAEGVLMLRKFRLLKHNQNSQIDFLTALLK
jgi:hypothetical protein